MAEMIMKGRVSDLYCQYQLRVSHDICLVPIRRLQPKSVTRHRSDKVKFTNGRTDGRTGERTYRWADAGNRSTPSNREAKFRGPEDGVGCVAGG